MGDHHLHHHQIVCCMCGDVGFSDKLFRCQRCHHRSQHSYCSNYYKDSSSSEPMKLCDWCQSEGRNSKHGSSSKKPTSTIDVGQRTTNRSEYSGDKIKQHGDHKDENNNNTEKAVKSPSGTPSPRTTTRRYKLLKDVMC